MNGIQNYQQVGIEATITNASPHRIVQMLFEGALQRIAVAKGYMLKGDYKQKGNYLGKAIDIIHGLRASLNMEKGGSISKDLDRLYEFFTAHLLQASMRNDPEMLDEVSRLLGSIKESWDKIPESVREQYKEQMHNNARQVEDN